MKKYTLFLAVCLVPLLSFGQDIVKITARTSEQTVRMSNASFLMEVEGAVISTRLGAINQAAVKDFFDPSAYGLGSVEIFGPLQRAYKDFRAADPGPLVPRVQANLTTPGGTLPPYGTTAADLPVDTKAALSDGLRQRILNPDNFNTLSDLDREFLVTIPSQVVLDGVQLTQAEAGILRDFYRQRFHSILDHLKENNAITVDDWNDAMKTIVNLGFFGTQEDAAAVVEFAHKVPADLVAFTELDTVFMLLNVGAYKELRELAALRATEEKWFDPDVPAANKRTLNAHLAAFWYIQSTESTAELPEKAYYIYSESLADMDFQPWIPQRLTKAGNDAREGTPSVAVKFPDVQSFNLRLGNPLLQRLLQNDQLPAIIDFMKLRGNLSPLLAS